MPVPASMATGFYGDRVSSIYKVAYNFVVTSLDLDFYGNFIFTAIITMW